MRPRLPNGITAAGWDPRSRKIHYIARISPLGVLCEFFRVFDSYQQFSDHRLQCPLCTRVKRTERVKSLYMYDIGEVRIGRNRLIQLRTSSRSRKNMGSPSVPRERPGQPHGGNLMEEEWGVWPGAVDENRGPHLTSALLIPPSERVRCTDFDPGPLARPPSHFLPSAASSPSAPACWGPV